jgi:RND family efflux transporter MFP subunit
MATPLKQFPRFYVSLSLSALLLLTACDESNTYVAPPPPKVTVAVPQKRAVTHYLETTGNSAAVNTASLVARASGFIQGIEYKDGEMVKKGTTLFIIEPDTYELKLKQAQASEDAARATLKQNKSDYERTAELASHGNASKQALDKATAVRESAQAKLQQAEADTKLAALNVGYTHVTAPFDSTITARQVSIGDYVGATASPTVLATAVQLDPIHVNFNVSEQDVLRIRAEMRKRGMTSEDLKKVAVEVGLQNETGYPHKGLLDYVSPTVDASTGTLTARAILQNPKEVLLPGMFVRVRVPLHTLDNALVVPDVALGTDQSGRYLLVVGKDNVVEQRTVEVGVLEGTLRVIEKGIAPDDRVVVNGILRAVPGQKVEPHMAASTPPSGKTTAN